MTNIKRHHIEEGAAVIIIVALILWVLFHLFGSKPASVQSGGNSSVFTPSSVNLSSPVIDLATPANENANFGGSTYNIGSDGSEPCCCSTSNGGCSLSVNEIPTLAKIISLGNAASAAITQAGNNTLAALAQANSSPLLNINYVQG